MQFLPDFLFVPNISSFPSNLHVLKTKLEVIYKVS